MNRQTKPRRGHGRRDRGWRPPARSATTRFERRTRGAATALMLLALLALLPLAAAGAEPPNVLFIVIDDLNDWTGALGGHPQAETPNLDRLAARGVLFTNAHAPAPACGPSRAAVLTGVPPHRSGVYDNRQAWRPAIPDAVTLPQWFRRHGYWAGGSGKIFHTPFPDPPSWDEFWPSKELQRPEDPKPDGMPLNGIPDAGLFDWGPVPVPVAEMADARVVDWVVERSTGDLERPFFLAVGIYRPHLPWYVPPEYFDRRPPLDRIVLPEVPADDLDDVPPMGRRMARPGGDHARVVAAGEWSRAVRAYLASIAFADEMLGRVLEGLERSGRRDDTIIVLWSDHGWHLGEKQHWRKFTLWEESTRVPLVIVAPPGTPGLPAGTPKGVRSSRPVSLIDLYRTLAELAGLPAPPSTVEGESLVPLLREPGRARLRPALTTNGRGNHALRGERYRYIRYADGTEELYDHAVDPNEWTNLAGRPEHRATIDGMARWLPAENAPEQPRRRAGEDD